MTIARDKTVFRLRSAAHRRYSNSGERLFHPGHLETPDKHIALASAYPDAVRDERHGLVRK